MNLIENVERGAELYLILLLLVRFADPLSSEIDVSDRIDRQTDRRTDSRNKHIVGLPGFKKLSSESTYQVI